MLIKSLSWTKSLGIAMLTCSADIVWLYSLIISTFVLCEDKTASLRIPFLCLKCPALHFTYLDVMAPHPLMNHAQQKLA